MADARVAGSTAVKKKKTKRNVPVGVAHIQATFNNTIVTITDPAGNVLATSSCGANGFKGSRKSTPFAAQVAGDVAARKARESGIRSLTVRIKVTLIKDITPVPHNGCRARKSRRV